MPTGLAVAVMALGALAIIRAALIIAVGSDGSFRGDPWVMLVLGFGFCLTGIAILD